MGGKRGRGTPSTPLSEDLNSISFLTPRPLINRENYKKKIHIVVITAILQEIMEI